MKKDFLKMYVPDREKKLAQLERFATTPAEELDIETVKMVQRFIRKILPKLKNDVPVIASEELLLMVPSWVKSKKHRKRIRDSLIYWEVQRLRDEGHKREVAEYLVAKAYGLSPETVKDIFDKMKKTTEIVD